MSGKFIYPTKYLSQIDFEEALGRKSWCFWLTGNSGSGKSTLAKSVEKMIMDEGYQVACLAGDNLRDTIN